MLPLLAVLTAAILSGHWAEGRKYNVVFKNDYPLEPCNLDGFTYVDTEFDLSNITFTRDDNDVIILSGSFKMKKDVGLLELSFEGNKFDRGNWVPMLMLSKPDYCEFITSPTEGAETVFENMEPKRCPFNTDTVYTIKPTALKMEYDISYSYAQGEYTMIAKFFNKQKNISSCVKILCDIH